MDPVEVKPGRKFHDDGLKSQPTEYRVHVVEAVDGDRFTARHVASGNTRPFALTQEGTANLRVINRHPHGDANLDHLVGARVVVELTMGSKVRGEVTAVRYETMTVEGATIRYVREVEIDKAGGSSYPPSEIVGIQIVSG